MAHVRIPEINSVWVNSTGGVKGVVMVWPMVSSPVRRLAGFIAAVFSWFLLGLVALPTAAREPERPQQHQQAGEKAGTGGREAASRASHKPTEQGKQEPIPVTVGKIPLVNGPASGNAERFRQAASNLPPLQLVGEPIDLKIPPAPPALDLPKGPSHPEPPPISALELPQEPLQVRIEAERKLSLAEVLQLAVTQNPQVQQAQLQVEERHKGVKEMTAAYWPQWSLQGNYSYAHSPQPGEESNSDFSNTSQLLDRFGIGQAVEGEEESSGQSQFSGNALVRFTVFDGGARAARSNSAKNDLSAAELELQRIQKAVRLDAAQAYYEVQRADTQVMVAKAALAESEASLRDARALKQAGMGTLFEVLQAQTRVANNREEWLSRQSDQRIARSNLAALLNFKSTPQIVAVDPIQPTGKWELSLEETIVAAFQNRPEFDIERQQAAANSDRAKESLASTRPSVDVFASYDLLDDLKDEFSVTDGYALGFNVGWKFFDGGVAVAQAQQSDLRAQQDASQFQQVRNDIRREVEDGFYSLQASRDRMRASKAALASASQQLQLARMRLRAGLGTQTDINAAESELSEARGRLANAVTDYNLSIVRLERAVNNL
jgi:OMF family outer membrane factor